MAFNQEASFLVHMEFPESQLIQIVDCVFHAEISTIDVSRNSIFGPVLRKTEDRVKGMDIFFYIFSKVGKFT